MSYISQVTTWAESKNLWCSYFLPLKLKSNSSHNWMDNQEDFTKSALNFSNDPLTLATPLQAPVRDNGTAWMGKGKTLTIFPVLFLRSHVITHSESTLSRVRHLRHVAPKKVFSLAVVTCITTIADLLETVRKDTGEAILPLLRYPDLQPHLLNITDHGWPQ